MDITVIGGSGYTGRELIRILQKHPNAGEITVTSTRYAGKKVNELHPDLKTDLMFEKLDLEKANQTEVVFCCTPHTKTLDIVAKLTTKVVDLSADYRLKNVGEYEKYYGVKHTHPELVEEAVYGLAELHRDKIKDARLVANPGCFPTAIILGLAPLMKFKPEKIIVDAKTGYSGAGRKSEEEEFKKKLEDNSVPYKITGHQHTPELEQELGMKIGFTPHLLPLERGILCTFHVYVKVKSEQIKEEYEQFYEKEPFVKWVEEVPTLHDVQYTNDCHIGGFAQDEGGRFVFFSVIDNLIKGASGQAVQNMNLMFGYDESAGLS